MVFFISDTHFGHRAICKYRPEFESPKQHDETIISNWNKVVTNKRMVVWVLGDMCISNKEYDMKSIISSLNGRIKLLTGNHCNLEDYKDTKIEIQRGITKEYGFWLSHAPIHPDELRGHKNIHGHVHNKTINDSRYINVCCENIGYTPISLDEIRRQHDYPTSR